MTSRSRTRLLLAALALAAIAAALLLARGPGGGASQGDAAVALPAPPPGPSPVEEAREPDGASDVATSDGWSRRTRAEVNAAGLARAASRREKEREAECAPGKGGEGRETGECDPERGAGSVEIDWNGRRPSP